MRISAIQTSVYRSQLNLKVNQPKLREEAQQPNESQQVSFKSEGATLWEVGLGAMTAVGVALMAGAAPIFAPVIVAAGAIGGVGIANKIEDKLTGTKNNNK